MKHKFYWLNPKVEPKNTGNKGTGLIATKKILKNEKIIVIGGYVMTVDEESKLPGKCSDNGVQISEELVLSISKSSEYGGFNFLNHSCKPNAGFNGQIFIVAMRDIAKGEEVTIDYAMVLYKAKIGPRYKLSCLCGEPSCRKIITDEDWKNDELKKKYKGYFQYFIQEKIDKQKAHKRK